MTRHSAFRSAAAAAFAVLLLAGGAAAAAPAASPCTVRFAHPDRYADAYLHGGFGDAARAPTLDMIAQTLRTLSGHYLAPGQTLEVDILDVDLAGRLEPWRPTAPDLRVMREVDWPRIKLRYVLKNQGREVRRAEAVVSDQTYLTNAAIGRSDDPYRYDRAMLTDWFRGAFAADPRR